MQNKKSEKKLKADLSQWFRQMFTMAISRGNLLYYASGCFY